MGSGNADLGNWKTAVVWYETTLNLAKKNLGPEQELTVWTMNGLALAYIELERPGEAVTLLETTLRIRTEKLGPEAPRTLWIMHYLARAYRELGRWEESSNLFRKTLNLREKVLGPNHPDTMSTRNEMESLEKCRAGSPSK
jgi:tetratricopeptide (TPR) repeat protein